MAATIPASTGQKKKNPWEMFGANVNGVLNNLVRGNVPTPVNQRQAALSAVSASLGGAPRVASKQQLNTVRPQTNYANPITSVARSLIDAPVKLGQRTANIAGAGVAGVTGLGLAGIDKLRGNEQGYKTNLIAADSAVRELLTKGLGGVGGGSFGYEQARNADNNTLENLVKPVLGYAGEASQYVLPYGVISKATAPLAGAVANKVTTGLVGKVAPKATQYAAEGALAAPIIAGAGAIKQFGDTGQFDPTQALQEGAVGGAFTSLGAGALGLAGASARKTTNLVSDSLPLQPVYAAGDDLPIVGKPLSASKRLQDVPPTTARQIQDQSIQKDLPAVSFREDGLSPSTTTKLVESSRSRPVKEQLEAKSNPEKNYTYDMSIPLPEINTKTLSGKPRKSGFGGTLQSGKDILDKMFKSTRSIIEHQGKSGKQLAGKLQQSRDTQELYLAELQKAMPSVTKLARKGRNAIINKDYENFVDATQGLAKPKNDLVARAVKEWRSNHPLIRQRAVNAGLDVGDLGENYYPHFVDYDALFKDKNTYNKAINHLVETGQAKDQSEAIKLLGYARDTSRNREFGNLEASRLIDLPFYDKTSNSLISYLNGSTKRIAQTEMFGKSDEEALKLIAKIGEEGGNAEAAKNAFDIAVGAKNYNPTSEAVSRNIRRYLTTTRLGLAALTNISQSVNTGVVTGNMRALGAMFKQLSRKDREFALDAGVISDALLNDIRTQQGTLNFSQKFVGKVIDKLTVPGMNAVEKFNRSVSAVAGRDYGLRLAQTGKIDTLRKLGVTGEIRDKTLTEAQQVQVARKVVEKTQFKVDPQDLPGWVDTPGGKLVAQFRTFSYNQGKFFSNEILKPAATGNLLPLGRLLAALPVGYGLYEARRNLDGRPIEEDKLKVGLAAFSKVGGAGLAVDIYNSLNPVGSKYLPDDRRVTMAIGGIAGPAAGVGAEGYAGLSALTQRKNLPADPSTLDGKVALGVNDEGYTDATGISRFALKQIPIVGSAIMNRVLPYKKESNLTKDQQEQYNSLPEDQKAAFKTEKEAENTAVDKDRKALTKMKFKGEESGTLPSGKVVKKVGDSYRTYDNQAEADLAEGKEKYKQTKDPKQKYQNNLAQFNADKAARKLSDVEIQQKETALAKESITSKYNDDVKDFYSLSKAAQEAYFKRDRAAATRLYDQAKAMDAELLNKGLIQSSKFKTTGRKTSRKSGGSTRTASTKRSTSRGSSRSKSSFALNPALDYSIKQSTALRKLVKRPTYKRKVAKA